MKNRKNFEQATQDGFELATQLKNAILDKHSNEQLYAMTVVISVMQCLAAQLAESQSPEFVRSAIEGVLTNPVTKDNTKKYLN